jgi:hypothetical protein
MKDEKNEIFKLSRENLAWFKDNYKSLRKDYDNQWIVIQKKQVVANGSSYDRVIEGLKKKDKKSAIVEFVDSRQIAMFF